MPRPRRRDEASWYVLDASTAHITQRDSERLRRHWQPPPGADLILSKILRNTAVLPVLLGIDPSLDIRISEAIQDPGNFTGPIYDCYDGGFWVKVPDPLDYAVMDDWNLSDCFKELIRYASGGGYDWVRIDEDGAVIRSLPTNSW